MIKLNIKKSQIGTTLTWMAAMIVMLLIIFIYILGVMQIAAMKGKSGTSISNFLNYNSNSISNRIVEFDKLNYLNVLLNDYEIFDGKKVNLKSLISEYSPDMNNENKKNDLTCFFRIQSFSLGANQGYYPALTINNLQTILPDGQNLNPLFDNSELFIEKSFVFPSNSKNILVNFKFMSYDLIKPYDISFDPSESSREKLESEISTLRSENRLYDQDCISIEDKIQFLKMYDSLNKLVPISTKRTPEELIKIEEILSDKLNIRMGSTIYTYDSAKDKWDYVLEGLGYGSNSYESMKSLLIGQKLNILNAKKENNRWEIAYS